MLADEPWSKAEGKLTAIAGMRSLAGPPGSRSCTIRAEWPAAARAPGGSARLEPLANAGSVAVAAASAVGSRRAMRSTRKTPSPTSRVSWKVSSRASSTPLAVKSHELPVSASTCSTGRGRSCLTGSLLTTLVVNTWLLPKSNTVTYARPRWKRRKRSRAGAGHCTTWIFGPFRSHPGARSKNAKRPERRSRASMLPFSGF
mmetsp:Transcript_19724/g.63316  ORF Transcript_19724/g.63316 Transcript_19724/m.63316 type:complete len:201 (+) Transcript_19724:628-1230(+)